MAKKLLALILGVAVCLAFTVGMKPAQASAIAFSKQCSGATCCDPVWSVCGYFEAWQKENANCNVLPSSANWCTGNSKDVSNLYGLSDVNSFTGQIGGYLNDGGGSAYDINARTGAAFIVDAMLGIDQNNGWPPSGVNDARAQFNNWKARVNALAKNTCNGSPTGYVCPGTSFGINWNFTPSEYAATAGLPAYCSTTHHMETAYDNNAVDRFGNRDATIFPVYLNSSGDRTSFDAWECNKAYTTSVPDIVLYWNGGANKIIIGSKCGNLQEVPGDTLPPPNQLPWGQIQVLCDSSTGQQTAVVKFGDADGTGGNTWAYVYTGGQMIGAGGAVNTVIDGNSPYNYSANLASIPIPPWVFGPYASQTVTLYVEDIGPLVSPNTYDLVGSYPAKSCVTVNCLNALSSPSPLDPYMRYSLTVSAVSTASSAPPNPTISLDKVVSPGGVAYGSQPSIGATPSGSAVSATFTNIAPTSSAGGSGTGIYTAYWSVYSNGTLIKQCSGPFQVVNLPYVNIYGGDAMGGASPDYNGTSSSCATNSSGGLYGWNGLGAAYYGAGDQYAIQALGAITGFATALQSSNSKPDGLSFANNYTPPDSSKESPGAGLFGGYFGDTSGSWTGSCDFTSDLTGAQQVNGAKSFGATNVSTNSDVWEVTGGDVYIGGNITYGTTAWASASAIPYLKLVVVGGDIYINSSVTELDGLYVSEPSGGAGGHIYTCASAPSTAVTPTTANYFSTCHNPLAIHGAFVAQQVQFGRTYGSLGQASGDTAGSNHDAEVFYYSPELWLPRNSALPGNGYAAITGLPPVL